MICKICGKTVNNFQGLSKHITSIHHIKNKQVYYDKYLKVSDDEGFCLTCGKPTLFIGISKGYKKHCNSRCAQLDVNTLNAFIYNNPQKDEKIKQKTKETCIKRYGVANPSQSELVKEKLQTTMLNRYGVKNSFQQPQVQKKARYNSHTKDACNKRKNTILNKIRKIARENDCIYIKDLLAKTKSSGWYQSNVVPIYKINGYLFVKNNDISKVITYDKNTYKTYSIIEKHIVNSIKKIYTDTIIENSKKIITPQELDIYLPNLKLAIEFNGSYFHSDIAGIPKCYHLNKSLRCREKGIRLVHIYEFEDLEKQICLLLDLINGNDNYPKNDFNKNNLLKNIPKEPALIYEDNRLKIYGAGKLY